MDEYTFTTSSDAKKEELTQHYVGLFAFCLTRSPN